jgi:outer membrane immunogenic protein
VVDPWVGYYAGGNIGYSWGRTTTTSSVSPFGSDDLLGFGSFGFQGATSSQSTNVNGVIGGLQTGYVGRIAPHWLGGIETDFQWSRQRGSGHSALGGNALECTSGDCSFLSLHDVTTRLDWFGTIRGRAGYETNGLWFYGTGGLAYGKVSVSGSNTLVLTDNTGPAVIGTFVTPFNYSQVKGGWTAGFGVEGLIGDGRWRWKAEYLHIDLGSINGGFFGTFPVVQANTAHFTDEIVRVGFNYRFDQTSDPMNAFGADLPTKALKAPPPASFRWTGWYAGINAGYIDTIGRTNTDADIVTTSSAPQNAFSIANGATNQFNEGHQGFLGGAQVGYNYQFSRSFVGGLEADIQGTKLHRDYAATNTVALSNFGPSWIASTQVSNSLDYLGTVRARLGVTPTPNVLVYSTGGLAFGGVRSNTQINFTNDGGATPGATSGSFSDTRYGWTAGAGAEWMFGANWTAKLEYLYYDLGTASYATGGYAVDVGPTRFPGFGIETIATRTSTRFEGSIVRVGLNYKFGDGPVVARY